MAMTPGQVLLADIFPSDVYKPGMQIDKKSVRQLYTELADRHPDKYREILHKSTLLGRDVAVGTGGASFSMDNLRTPVKAGLRRDAAKRDITALLDSLPPEKQSEAIVKYLANMAKTDKDETVAEAELDNNPLVRMLKGAGRGNPASIARLISSDLMYSDSEGNPIPIPVLNSYSRGLTTAEYLASAFGARKGLTETKLSVASSGYMAKLLSSAAHRQVVTGEDAPADLIDSTLDRGLPVETLDEDNVGSLLAKDVGPFKRNTVITPKIMAKLDKLGHDEILVRSALTTADPDGGVYARDIGVREKQRLAQTGESVGITAAAALSEPITQLSLSSKHSGGVAKGDTKEVPAFEMIEKLFNTPKEFREAATHAQADGVVTAIRDAPQGGQYVLAGGEEHYVPDGSELLVKVGDTLEAGDQLNAGVPNPREVIRHKGLGEGARQLTNTLRKSIRDAGSSAHRRNIELVVRGLVDRVRVSDEFDDYSPDDIVPYNQIASKWKPREGHKVSGLQQVAGRYLESPVMHYTIGTRLTPSVVKRLQKHNIKQVTTHADPPPFMPEAVRAIDLLRTDQNWQTRQIGTGLTKGLLDATHRGLESDPEGTSFVAGRAEAVDFNRKGKVRILPSPLNSPLGRSLPTQG